MTIDEAIQHCRKHVSSTECGMEHKQLVDWLCQMKLIEESYGSERGEFKIIWEYCDNAMETIMENSCPKHFHIDFNLNCRSGDINKCRKCWHDAIWGGE